MSKTFADWIKERRKTVILPSGIEVVVREPLTWKAAEMGPLPGIDDLSETSRNIAVYRRYVDACLVSMGGEDDPIGRGLCTADDFSLEDGNAIMVAAISLLPQKEATEDGVPLADTDSPQPTPES